ncbi:Panacea domain-containing protein [Novosphingobium sp. 9U]|uniref:Panacea domain-containing protein n=1 Tax=Novosphingobium sp. 9U TaxID=2653158 RepID=UPI001359BEAD|nr:type II toxin-antitoxin system antitoxin SocA domain-containing protein [Novosphingobium sp. 9U]
MDDQRSIQAPVTSAPYDIKGLANLLLDWADAESITMTPMKLQKLLYFCHADYLRAMGKPLVRQDFEAWDYGPVEPSVFAEFKSSSKSPIKTRAMQFVPATGERVLAEPKVDDSDLKLLRSLYNIYKHASATALSDLSHETRGPWAVARHLFNEGRNADRRMSAKLIIRYHQRGPLS